jgi:four helix bundle protein
MNNEQRIIKNGKNVLREKSYAFALQIVETSKELNEKKKEYVLSKQLLRSGTSIGAMVRESEYGQSKADFINKLSVALKEANETDYWLSLLKDSGYLNSEKHSTLSSLCTEIIKITTASINTAKGNR